MKQCQVTGWEEFTEESFDSKDCKCAYLENHAMCPIHGYAPEGGHLREKYLYHKG